jgi:DNA replication protein DnaC
VLVRRHRADDSVTKAITRILRADLIVVDDIGLLPVAADAAEGLYRLVDAACERRSVAVSSNLHPSKAHQFAQRYASPCLKFTGAG